MNDLKFAFRQLLKNPGFASRGERLVISGEKSNNAKCYE
jgi:hypothetical protein